MTCASSRHDRILKNIVGSLFRRKENNGYVKEGNSRNNVSGMGLHGERAVTKRSKKWNQRDSIVVNTDDDSELPVKYPRKKISTERQAKKFRKKAVLEELFSSKNGKNIIEYSGKSVSTKRLNSFPESIELRKKQVDIGLSKSTTTFY